MKLLTYNIWDLYAFFYDKVSESVPYRQLLTQVVSRLDLKSGQKILDAGCGTAHLEILVASLPLKKITLEAVDNNPGMLNRASQKKLSLKVNLRRVDLNEKLTFPDLCFDRVVVVHVLYALSDPAFTLREFFRVLKPQGLLVLANPHSHSNPLAIMKANLEGLNFFEKVWLVTRYLPLIIINLIICRLGHSGEYHFLGEPELKKLLQEAGFAHISTELAYADQDLLVSAAKED